MGDVKGWGTLGPDAAQGRASCPLTRSALLRMVLATVHAMGFTQPRVSGQNLGWSWASKEGPLELPTCSENRSNLQGWA